MLQCLGQICMRVCEEIGDRAVNSPYHPELKHDCGRSINAASRAARLTFAFERRAQAEVIAMRNGTPLSELIDTPRDPIAAAPTAVPEPVREEPDDGAPENRARERTRESLIEREDFEEGLQDVPVQAGIAAIRAELGVKPDASARAGYRFAAVSSATAIARCTAGLSPVSLDTAPPDGERSAARPGPGFSPSSPTIQYRHHSHNPPTTPALRPSG